jgi:FAD-dependent oxidoreductase domain-containing protein 1
VTGGAGRCIGFTPETGARRALAELIVHGEYRTIDLTPMGYQRVLDQRPYAERGIR